MIKASEPRVTTAVTPRPRAVTLAALVVATLTLLSAVIAIGSTGLIKVWATAAVLSCALIIVLVTRVQKGTRR